jgi:small subunit ribosomal protein S20e
MRINNRFRLTISGTSVKPIEATCSQIINAAKDHEFKVKGPVRMPTRVLRVTVRKSPCGEGTNTWDRYEMRIHKRVVDLYCPSELVKEVTSFKLEPGVDVNVNVSNL